MRTLSSQPCLIIFFIHAWQLGNKEKDDVPIHCLNLVTLASKEGQPLIDAFYKCTTFRKTGIINFNSVILKKKFNTICQLQMLTKGQLSHQYKYHSLIKKKKKKGYRQCN